jgi:hypothetical protein
MGEFPLEAGASQSKLIDACEANAIRLRGAEGTDGANEPS